MDIYKKRIVFFAESVTLAHVARCITLADLLHQTGRYHIVLAVDSRFDHLLGDLAYQKVPLNSVSSAYFSKQLKKGSPLYDVKTLSAYVDEDLRVIDEFKPDFIFGDFRLSLSISSELSNIPYATITNAYWSPYADIKYPVPDILLTKLVGVTIAQKVFDFVKPVIFKVHSLALNNTRHKFGLKSISYDMRDCYTHADYTLYADYPSLIPMQDYPTNHLFIGPLLWSVKQALPNWWTTLPDNKPIVFVTLGSSGESAVLPTILQALSQLDVTVICATANDNNVTQSYPSMFIEKFLPAAECVKKADIVICNGGSPMVYQSLQENKKVIGIPSNLDQYLMMTIVQQAAQGSYLRSANLKMNKLKVLVAEMLDDVSPEKVLKSVSCESTLEKIEHIIELSTKKID